MPRNILDQNWFDFFNKNGLQWQEGSLFDKNFTADQVGNLYSIAGNVAGTAGDVVNDISNQYYAQNAGRADLANTVSGNSWGDVFSNDDKLSQGLQNIDAGITDVSNINNLDTLQNITINQQDEVNDSVEVGSIVGSTLGDTAKGAAAGSMFGPVGMLIGGAAGLIEGGARSVVSAIQHNKNAKIENAAIRRANRQSVNNYYNQVGNITQRRQRDWFMHTPYNYQHAEGGLLNEFNTGDSHENNPLGGIPQGIASDGLPNLVEEGEVRSDFDDAKIFNNQEKNYTITEKDCEEYLLPKSVIGCNPAEAIKKLKKEYEDRVNDPISIATMKEWDSRVFAFQEDKTAKLEENKAKKAIKNMSDEEKVALLSSLGQPMAQPEGIDLSQPMYAEGGKIYIKPSHRGRLTELKKRTGKSEAELWKTGSPATRKMITFARNARKWHKHDGESGTQYLNIGFPWSTYQTTGAPLVDYSLTPRQEVILAAANPATTFGELTQLRDNLEANNLKAQQNLDLALLNDKIQRANLGVTVGDWQLKPSKSFNAPLLEEDKSQPLGVKVTNKTKPNNNDNNSFTFNGSMLRYAPAVGSGIGALVAALQPKDYDLANRYRSIAASFKPVSAPHIGGYRRYTPYDVNLGDAENLALQTAALNANRGQNRATQGALNTAVLAKSQEANAKRNLAAQQANEANRLAVDTYNLGIDQFNAQRDSQYDQLNQQILTNKLNMLGKAAEAEDASKTAWANMYNATHENLYNQLGNVGRDEWNRNRALTYLEEHPEIFTDEYLNKLGFIRK